MFSIPKLLKIWGYENIFFYYAKVVTLSSISIIFQHMQYVDTIETKGRKSFREKKTLVLILLHFLLVEVEDNKIYGQKDILKRILQPTRMG